MIMNNQIHFFWKRNISLNAWILIYILLAASDASIVQKLVCSRRRQNGRGIRRERKGSGEPTDEEEAPKGKHPLRDQYFPSAQLLANQERTVPAVLQTWPHLRNQREDQVEWNPFRVYRLPQHQGCGSCLRSVQMK